MTGVTPNVAAFLRDGQASIPALVGVKFSHTAVFDMQAALAVDDGRYNLLFGSDEMLLSGLAAARTAQSAAPTTLPRRSTTASSLRFTAEWLAQEGIESISLNPDTVIDTWQRLAKLRR